MEDQAHGAGWWVASDGNWYPPEQHPQAAVTTEPPSPGTAGPAAGPRASAVAAGRAVVADGAARASRALSAVPASVVAFLGYVSVAVVAILVIGVGFGSVGGDACSVVDLDRVREVTQVRASSVEAVSDASCVIRGTVGDEGNDRFFTPPRMTIAVSVATDLSETERAGIVDDYDLRPVEGVEEGREAWLLTDEAWVRDGDVWVHVEMDGETLQNHSRDAAVLADDVASNR